MDPVSFSRSMAWAPGLEAIEFRCQDKIAFRQSIDLVGPDLDVDLAPREQQIGMMPLLLRHRAGAVDEIEGGLEVGKGEAAGDMVAVDHLPIGHLGLHGFQRFAGERRDPSAAGNAVFFGKTHMGAPIRTSKVPFGVVSSRTRLVSARLSYFTTGHR